jgi:hypothetical protein
MNMVGQDGCRKDSQFQSSNDLGKAAPDRQRLSSRENDGRMAQRSASGDSNAPIVWPSRDRAPTTS